VRKQSGGGFDQSGVGINKRAEHFVGRFFHFGASLDLDFASFKLDHVAGQIGALAAVYGTQTLVLKVGGLAFAGDLDGIVRNLSGRVIDARLTDFHGAEAWIQGIVSGDLHGAHPQFIKRTASLKQTGRKNARQKD